MSKFIIIGASRGLGFEIYSELSQHSSNSGYLVSRKPVETQEGWESVVADMTTSKGLSKVAGLVSQCAQEEGPELSILYVAGGGPHGDFARKAHKDHLWSYKLNFLAPSELLHTLLAAHGRRRFLFVGSAIAESRQEKSGASYLASKIAMVELIRAIRKEVGHQVDLRVYSPGYIDTELIPKGAVIRNTPELLLSPRECAKDMLNWFLGETDQWHRVFSKENDVL